MNAPRASGVPTVLLAIAVLILLFVLMFPSVTVGPSDSRGAQAKNDVSQIATAVTAFETEYGHLPGTNSGVVGQELLTTLTGGNPSLNPRLIVFLEVSPAKKGRSGIRDGVFVDPWGGPYQIAYANGADTWVTAGTNRMTIPKRVGVWNDPELGKPDRWFWQTAKLARRGVTSWD